MEDNAEIVEQPKPAEDAKEELDDGTGVIKKLIERDSSYF